jgi:RHS repeat-associated protein
LRKVTDSSGTVQATYDYDAYANQLPSTSDSISDGGLQYRFVGTLGVRWDATTGLYYMRQRWYDPAVQRFVSRDLMRSVNRYRYANNNPVLFTDSSGLDPSQPTAFNPQQLQMFNEALGLLTEAGYGYEAHMLQNMYNQDPSKSQIYIDNPYIDYDNQKNNGNGNAITDYQKVIRFQSSVFDLHEPNRTFKGCPLADYERLYKVAMLASQLHHELSHFVSGDKGEGYEKARYDMERQVIQKIWLAESAKKCSYWRIQAIYEAGFTREDQGYNAGGWGGSLSGPRYFPRQDWFHMK